MKYKIEFLPVLAESVHITPAEWAVVVISMKQPDFNVMIAELQKRFKMKPDEIKKSIASLQKKRMLKLLQSHEADQQQPSSDVPKLFWKRLSVELSKAIGPIADIVIDDALASFNLSKETLTSKSIYSLVERVSAEIGQTGDRKRFQETMLMIIKDK